MNKSSYKELKKDLWNGIVSCPIVYVNHYHFQYIDDVLKSLLQENRLSPNCVAEYDYGQKAVVSFLTKEKDREMASFPSIKSLLQYVVFPSVYGVDELEDGPSEEKHIILFKGLSDKILKDDEVLSLLQTFAAKYESGLYNSLCTIIIVSPQDISIFPPTVRKLVTVVELYAPTPEEIRNYILSVIGEDNLKDSLHRIVIEDMVRSLQGMQMYEVKQTLKTVLKLNNGRISNKTINLALEEKQRIVKKSGIIEVIDTDVSFEDVGGLDKLREDLEIKSRIFNNLGDAEKYHVPVPKGVLILGMPGCGKSMIAKATANKFHVSLLRLDVSRLMGKYIGESEANLRLALATAEAAHPCVLWIDEIEKAFAGSNGNSDDEGNMLVMRLMGHFLTWMQERKAPVFIVATANDVMRPEFMRKGRFDEVYFVDFPTEKERAQILRVKIDKRYPQNAKDKLFDFSEIGDCSNIVKEMEGKFGGFSGSEIECVLNMVVETRFLDYLKERDNARQQTFRPSVIKITKSDFMDAINEIKPSVMSNQESKKTKDEVYMHDKTPIERIKEMQDTYNFVNASKK